MLLSGEPSAPESSWSVLCPSVDVPAVSRFCCALLVLPVVLALNPLSHNTKLLTLPMLLSLPSCKQGVTFSFSAALESSQLPLNALLSIHLASVCVFPPFSPFTALSVISPCTGNIFFSFLSLLTPCYAPIAAFRKITEEESHKLCALDSGYNFRCYLGCKYKNPWKFLLW